VLAAAVAAPAPSLAAKVLDWGSNSVGQLGNGTTTNSDVPVDVWGEGGGGQLAQGEKEESRAREPISVIGLTEVKAVAAGCGSLYALKKNGTVMAWGDNEHGQLGNGGPPGYVKEPVAVKGLKGVKAIAAGRFFALALVKGTVKAWGEGSVGELGNGEEKASSNVPVAVSGLTGVKAIAGGGYSSLALMSDTTVKSWGDNNVGQLGTGAAGPESCEGVGCAKVPTAVSGLTEVKSISTGVFHGYALLKNKTVKAWGDDEFGQLGNAEVTLDQPAPVAVSGLTGAVLLAVGCGGENFDSLAAT
jgi:hypothetical protein